jgi:type VI secretion system secreted protein Hcp
MATEAYVTIHGKVQGAFRGNDKPGLSSQIISFHYDVQSPRDSSSGQVSGKRQHKPISIVKEWGLSVPQLFQALVAVAGEVLTSVVIQLIDPHRPKRVSLTFHLTNATVSEMRHIGGEKYLASFVSAAMDVRRFPGPVPIPYPN